MEEKLISLSERLSHTDDEIMISVLEGLEQEFGYKFTAFFSLLLEGSEIERVYASKCRLFSNQENVILQKKFFEVQTPIMQQKLLDHYFEGNSEFIDVYKCETQMIGVTKESASRMNEAVILIHLKNSPFLFAITVCKKEAEGVFAKEELNLLYQIGRVVAVHIDYHRKWVDQKTLRKFISRNTVDKTIGFCVVNESLEIVSENRTFPLYLKNLYGSMSLKECIGDLNPYSSLSALWMMGEYVQEKQSEFGRFRVRMVADMVNAAHDYRRMYLMIQIIPLMKVEEPSKNIDNKYSLLETFNLSRREMQVIQMLVTGKENADIADKLYISAATLKTHIRNIYTKLDVSNKSELLLKLHQYNYFI